MRESARENDSEKNKKVDDQSVNVEKIVIVKMDETNESEHRIRKDTSENREIISCNSNTEQFIYLSSKNNSNINMKIKEA